MEVSHTPVDIPTPRDVWTALNDLPQRVNSLLKKFESSHAGGFEDFERELHALFAQTECAVTEEALGRHDVDLAFVLIDGEMHRRACRCAQTYLTAAGTVSVTRTLYRARRGERAVVLSVTLFRRGFLGLFLVDRGSICHIDPSSSESRAGAVRLEGQGGATVIAMITGVVVKMDWPAHPTPGSAGGG